jgi:hypothetical protein
MANEKRQEVRRVGEFVTVDKEFIQEAVAIRKLALARIGDTPQKRLAWLLWFMNTDLTVLREEEQVALGYDLMSLWLTLEGTDNVEFSPSVPSLSIYRMDQGELSEIQKWIKDGFRSLFSEKPRRWIFPAPEGIKLVRKSPLNAKRSDLTLVTVVPMILGTGGPRRRSIELAILEIVFGGRDLLRACSECGSPFIPVRRQEYCSTKCSQKARDRRRKKSVKGIAKEG